MAMTKSSEQPVLVDLYEEAGYALITLNRPEKRNALNEPLLSGMLEALSTLRDNKKIGVIITRGNEVAYSAGGDLRYMREKPGPLQPWTNSGLIYPVMRALRESPKITIASVRGWCVGGGLAFLVASDLAVVSETAQIGMPEIIRGSFGQYATSSLFHSGIPLKKAFYIQLTGRNLTGVEAERVGLATMAVPDDQVEAVTLDLAKTVAGHSHRALEHGKLTAYMGLHLAAEDAAKLDWLAGARLRLFSDPFVDVDEYLKTQHGGTNVEYRRPEK
jgi:enoyl-CoA hydratase/carnithine racemase